MDYNTPRQTSTRLEYIEGLKVIMLFCVVFCHLSEYLGIKYDHEWEFFWATLGAIGVSGFIILSGFGLTYSRLVSSVTNLQVIAFFYKRFLRLLPLYYLALFTYLLIVNLIEPANLLTHIFLVHTFFKDYSHNPGSLWFIGLTVQLYLFFPIAYKIMCQKRGLLFLGIVSVLLYALGIILDHNGFYVRESFISFTIQFFLGMNMAWHVYNGEIKRYLSPKIVIFAIIELCLFLIFVKTALLFKLPYYIYSVILNLSKINLFLITFNILIIIKNSFQHFHKFAPVLSAMSLASYSAYLFHRPILTVLTKGSAWNWVISHGFSDSQRFIILSIVGIPLIFLIGYWIQKAYDSMQKKFIIKVGKL
ncbi:MAG: acyltransferase family protein [Rhizonema sp. PD37]|nr:acyltransferase family protein [Rhizonema sp. PD37]